MPESNKLKQSLEEQKAKEELEKYDIYTMNDATVKEVKRAEKGRITL